MSEILEMAGPYVRKKKSVTRTMTLVMIALMPATLYGFYLYGWPSIILFTITLGSAMIFEILSLLIARKSVSRFATDGSALLTAWILAVSLPPWAPWWIAVVGSGVSLVIGKHVFGGLGQNVFNPAMVGRVVLLISFPLEMTSYVLPTPMLSLEAPTFLEGLRIVFDGTIVDMISGATVLDTLNTTVGQGVSVGEALHGYYMPGEWALGNNAGSMGEGPDLLLLLGGIMLVFTRVIRWHIPVSMLLSIVIISTIFNLVDPNTYPDALVHILTGSAMLGAFYIATDPVTSPTSANGQIVFGVMLGRSN